MDDKTTIERPPLGGLAYLFWTSGLERGSAVRLDPRGMTFGTSPGCEARMLEGEAGPEQARIRKEEDSWFLYDLHGRRDTLADGQPVYRHALSDGAVVTLARATGVVRILEGER